MSTPSGSSQARASSVAVWKVQILTPTCLVEGQLQPPQPEWVPFSSDDQSCVVTITAAELQFLSDSVPFVRRVEHWTMPIQTMIAFIPRDDASTTAVEQHTSTDSPTHSVILYAGPYRMRAALLNERADPRTAQRVALREADITALPEHPHLPRIRARLLLVNQNWISGYHPA